jgi:hypothetical protein
MCQVVYNSENACWTNIIKLYKMHGTYMTSLRCLIGDDLVQLLVCHPILQGIHLLRHEQSRTHLSVCQGTACHIILIYQIVLCACVWLFRDVVRVRVGNNAILLSELI